MKTTLTTTKLLKNKRRNMFRAFFVFLLTLLCTTIGYSQFSDSVVIKQGLVIKIQRSDESKIISPNGIVAKIETGDWDIPKENQVFEYNGKPVGTWKKISAGEDGWIRDDSLFNAYVHYTYNSPKNEIVILEAGGHNMVYVNGVSRSGNPYSDRDVYDEWAPRFDYSLLPVKMEKGENSLLFECNRGGLLKVKIDRVKEGLYLADKDLTVPDLFINETSDFVGALPIINATDKEQKNLLVKTWSGNSEPAYFTVSNIQALSVYKTPFYIKLPAQTTAGKVKLNIEIVSKSGSKEEVLASAVISLNVLNRGDIHKETFISKMDGSVQYYAVNPPVDLKTKPALFLSLHGAGVEAINQANAYSHKNWGYIVCPTNRRPYGFNWENWGRLDGLEVYNIAMKKFGIDSNRVYLTGHSMGGHGTWQLGINYSDKFAAIAPSAGWISIWGYRIGKRSDSSAVSQMLMRSAKHSDTYAFTTNLRDNGIYIIHGSADDNVFPDQAKSMMDNLKKIGKDFVYYEEPGAGHWWDNSNEPGADCVDWKPIFDMFAHRAVASNDMVRTIDFVTANPAVTSKKNWVEIINQVEQQKMSHVNINLEYFNRKFYGTTENILMLQIDASMLPKGAPVNIDLDKQLLSGVEVPADNIITLRKDNDKWVVSPKYNKADKNPVRLGNLREALNYDVVFVYGTHGNKEENTWAFEKSRYDAERLWYQGNASIEVLKDDEFEAAKYKDRSVMIYGNSKTNSAWNQLLEDSPVQVDNKKVKFGNKEYKGGDITCLFIRPRKDSDVASVGVIAGTGIEGMKQANLALYHHPYISFPDVTIYNSGILKSDNDGVKLIGYFGNDWSIEKGEFLQQ
jgi:dienelactone hydrolase